MSIFIDERQEPRIGRIMLVVAATAIALVLVLMAGLPFYHVWSASKSGEAALAHSNFEREVQVVNAKANLEAQRYNADAEVARANGVSQANHIIKESISDLYIKYLWVQTLDRTNNQIIYVPLGTDGLPVTEAGRAVR